VNEVNRDMIMGTHYYTLMLLLSMHRASNLT